MNTQSVALDFEIKAGLKVEPESLGGPEIPSQAECGVSCHPPSSMNDLVDSSRRNTDVSSQSVLRDPQGFEEFCREDLARMDRCKFTGSHGTLSVIVDDLDVIRIAILPSEANAPLIIHADAVLTHSVSNQSF